LFESNRSRNIFLQSLFNITKFDGIFFIHLDISNLYNYFHNYKILDKFYEIFEKYIRNITNTKNIKSLFDFINSDEKLKNNIEVIKSLISLTLESTTFNIIIDDIFELLMEYSKSIQKDDVDQFYLTIENWFKKKFVLNKNDNTELKNIISYFIKVLSFSSEIPLLIYDEFIQLFNSIKALNGDTFITLQMILELSEDLVSSKDFGKILLKKGKIFIKLKSV
jgi:hypothetical protein